MCLRECHHSLFRPTPPDTPTQDWRLPTPGSDGLCISDPQTNVCSKLSDCILDGFVGGGHLRHPRRDDRRTRARRQPNSQPHLADGTRRTAPVINHNGTLARVSSPSILVGHSYGGAVITAAGIDDRVVGLVYIAAVAPDEDETAASQQAKYPVTDVFQQIEVADGRVSMLPSGIGYFCGDLPGEEQEVVWATATPPAATLFTEKPPGTAWRTKPSAYIVASNDHAVHPDLERFSAKRMGATTYEIDSSHVPMLSHPEVVLTAIRNLVTSLQETLATA